jgi:beta-N-acetylhexosaminidase
VSTSVGRLALAVQLPAFAGTTLPEPVLDLLAEGLGGVCLFGSNTSGGHAAVAGLTEAVHRANPDAVVAVDEEGGDVTRLHVADGSPVLGPAALGVAGDLALTRDAGRLVGAELATLGIDLDLAPVADVNTNPDNPVIGTRSFGTDASRAAEQVVAWVTGLQEAGTAACAKHFPGHGDTSQDSHLALPTIDVGLDVLEKRELVPFAAAVDAGVAAVMTSHLVVPALDTELPATLSAPILGLLRDRLGFTGAIVTDALDMAGASEGRGIPEAAVLALAAGADLLCLGADKDVALVRDVQAAIVDAVESGRLTEDRLVEAARRAAGLRRARSHDSIEVTTDQLAGARAALEVQGELPDLRGATVVSVETVANIAVGAAAWGLPPDDRVDPADGTSVPGGDGPVVLQVRDAHRRHEVGALIRATEVERTVVVVEWGWPGPYDARSPRICTHGSSAPTVAAVRELLRMAGWDR